MIMFLTENTFVAGSLLAFFLTGMAVGAQVTNPVVLLPASNPSVTLNVWPSGKMPGHGATKPEQEALSEPDNVLRVSDVSDPTITVYQPRDTATPRPAMIVCPGGGYKILAMNLEGTEIASWLNSLGITAIILKYRVPDNRTGALQDLERAMHLVRAHEKQWRLNGSQIGVIGFSAGGHLCAHLSTSFEKPAYTPIDEIDKLSCRPDFVALIYPAYLGVNGKVAPELTITSNVPPTFIAQAENDTHFVGGTKLYDAALNASQVPHEFILFKTGGHGFGLRSKQAAKAWPDDFKKWLGQIKVLSSNKL